MMTDLDFSFVAEELEKVKEFCDKAPTILPRLLAYHKYKINVMILFGNIWKVSIFDSDRNVVWRHYFPQYEKPDIAQFGGLLLKDYMIGNVYSNRASRDTNDIQCDTIEELDLKLSLMGY